MGKYHDKEGHFGPWIDHFCPKCKAQMIIDDACSVWCSECDYLPDREDKNAIRKCPL